MNIFDLTTRPNENLYYKRNDPNDLRLGEHVKTSLDHYQESKFVILGSPQDIGVLRNKGRIGAGNAPENIRKAFYKLTVNEKIKSLKIFDLGNIKISKSLENIHADQEKVVHQILKDGKKVIALGGGNDISYPDCKALSNYNKNLLALNIDSHFDVRFDEPRNSGTSYRMLLEENLIDAKNFYEIGIKPFNSSLNHKNYLKKKNVPIFNLEEAIENGIENLFTEILTKNKCQVIFWGFDMDVVIELAAPGVSAPNPVGLSSNDAIKIAEIAGKDSRSKIFEISEVNPNFDIDNRTSKLAAIMMWNFLNFST